MVLSFVKRPCCAQSVALSFFLSILCFNIRPCYCNSFLLLNDVLLWEHVTTSVSILLPLNIWFVSSLVCYYKHRLCAESYTHLNNLFKTLWGESHLSLNLQACRVCGCSTSPDHAKCTNLLSHQLCMSPHYSISEFLQFLPI